MNIKIGTPLSSEPTKAVLLGSGELGKEVAIELQRYGIEVIALDKYENAPAMQVAHKSYVVSMLDGEKLSEIIHHEKPDFIIPEIEAIATDTLINLEKEGFNVIPSAKATKLTMNREWIRALAAEELSLSTSAYRFTDNEEEFSKYIHEIGFPCVVKPCMSSSGKGQSIVKNEGEIKQAWTHAIEGERGNSKKVIIEEFIDFDYEITLLTVSHIGGVSFCEPIGHRQENGDYKESWQPQVMSNEALNSAKHIAEKVVLALGGYGIFGVEFFVKQDNVYFSELSPRPHDTGMVTMISQDLSEFALHVRAILGLPIPNINFLGPSASSVITANGKSTKVSFSGIANAINTENTQVRLFGKPEIDGERRMGVCLARANTVNEAIEKAKNASKQIKVNY